MATCGIGYKENAGDENENLCGGFCAARKAPPAPQNEMERARTPREYDGEAENALSIGRFSSTVRKFFNLKESLRAKDQLGCTISTRRPMAGDIQLQCSDCGQDFTFTAADQAFFQERGYSTPKRCKNCRQAKKNDQGGSGYRSAPAQGTPVICSGCGQPTTVPFEPRGDRPVFCRDCYQARKGSGGGAGSSRGRGR
jgi:CxxC-x17-CxxC domain-containing protein